MRLDPQIKILKGDRLQLWNGEFVTNNMTSDVDETHVNITCDDDPYRFGIGTHRDGVREVWRNGVRIWPPMQLEMFGESEVRT